VRSKRAEILRQQQERRLYGATELPRLELPALLQSQTTDLGKMIFGSTGRLVDKWTHYPRAYEPHFSRFRETDVRMLEIGVYLGGSLDVWRQYFGPAATIFGIDIDPRCGERVTPPNQVRIGSQADPDFLAEPLPEWSRPPRPSPAQVLGRQRRPAESRMTVPPIQSPAPRHSRGPRQA